MFLSDLKESEVAFITDIDFESEFAERLNDMGFCKGERVVCVKKALLSSPILYRVKECNIALRKADAKHIGVRRCE